MAGAIKGITVEIGGNTTKLDKALGDVNKKTKDLQSELKGVNSLLKMDPGNVTLLKQKQDLLNESIANTKEKLNTLKEAQAQVQDQFDKGKITEEQYRDFQREIVATEQKLERLTDQMKEFGSVGAQKVALVGEKMKDVGGKVEDVGKKMSVVSGGIVALGTACVGSFYELDEGYDTIITKTGASGEALDSLNESADNVFSNMPVDMADVGVAIGEVNTRFGYTGTELENLSTKFLQFANINEVDLNDSIGTVDKILEQFNMTGEDAGGVLDLITQKAQQTGIGADTLMKLIQENGATFKDMGIGVNEAVVLLSQFEANGVNVETAVKGLKKATQEYTDEGLSMEEALGKTIDSIKNAKNDTEALAIAQEIFGTKGANEMAKAIREGRIDVDDLSASMESYSGTVENTFNETLDPVDEVKVGFNNLKLVGSQLGDTIQTALLPIINGLVSGLKKLNDWFSKLSPTTKTLIVVIAGIVASIGPVLIIVGKLISAVGSIMTIAPKIVTMVKGIGTAFKSLGALMSANPLGAIIIGITALVAGLIYAYNHSEKFREIVDKAFTKIKEVAGVVVDALVKFFTETIPNAIGVVIDWFKGLPEKIRAGIDSAKTVVSNVFNSIRDAISNAVNAVKTIITAVFTTIKTIITAYVTAWKTVITTVWNAIKTVVTGAVNVVKTIVTTVFNAIKTYITGVFNAYKSIITGVWNSIKLTVTTVINGIKTTITNVFNIVRNTISTVMNTIKSTISSVWNTIKSTVSSVVNGIKTVITSIFNAIKALLRGDMNAVKSHMSTAWNAIKSTVSSVVNGIKSVITTVFNGIKSVVSTVVNGIKSTISSVWNGIKSTTANVFNGIKSTMSNALTSAKNSVVNACKNIFTGMKNAFSNIKDTFRNIGTSVIDGIKNGITGAVSGLYNSIKNALSGLVDKAKKALGINSPSKVFANVVGKAIPEGVAKGVDDNVDLADNAVQDMADDLTNQANSLNGATINRKLATTFAVQGQEPKSNIETLANKLEGIYERLGRMQIVLDTGTLVGETIDKIDAGFADKQSLRARGV